MRNDDLIQVLTGGLTAKERDNICHWIASLPEIDYIDIHQDAAKKYYQLKDGHPDVPGKILHYCGLILSARDYGWDTLKGKEYRTAGEEQFEDWKKILYTRIQNLRKTNDSLKRRKILTYWGDIMQLKKNGVGFRKITQYLRQYRKIKVSSSYLHKIWKEMEEIHD